MRLPWSTVSGVLGLYLLLAPYPAVLADVAVVRLIREGGAGTPMTQEIDYFKDTMKRTDTKMEMTGKTFGMLLWPKDLSIIYRPDRDLVWEVNHANRTYRERALSVYHRGDKSGGERGRAGALHEGGAGGGNQEEAGLVSGELDVQKTGEKRTISGFPCSLHVLTWLVETEEEKSKRRNKFRMTGNFWNTEGKGKIKEVMAAEDMFERAYLEKTGLDMTPGDMRKFGLWVLPGAAGLDGKELKAGLEKMKGYSVLTSIKWEVRREMGRELGGEGGNFQTLFEYREEIKSLDAAALPDSHFEVPKDYKMERGVLQR
ncbi:MAG: hypothetical protein GTN70_05495 [Deltaproteobacteria bacterium]|nr:hypothetical protein [Deltaproteobacteria bacterium]NIS77133.1 hypothetical protein [Deltaproteobacteria bacterium]